VTAASALAAGRRAAESLMTDACTVRAVTGQATDQTTGAVTPAYSAPLYTGRCKVQSNEMQERTPEAAGADVTVLRYSVHVPVAAFAPAIGQVVAITSAASDPNLAGRAFRVVALLHKSQATAYRLGVEEVV